MSHSSSGSRAGPAEGAATRAAALAVHDKEAGDEAFLAFLTLVRREAGDGRNYVKKAVNRALRTIGRRDVALHQAARDALRGLTSEKVRRRLELRVR